MITNIYLCCSTRETSLGTITCDYLVVGIDLPEQEAHDVVKIAAAWPAERLGINGLVVAMRAQVVSKLVKRRVQKRLIHERPRVRPRTRASTISC